MNKRADVGTTSKHVSSMQSATWDALHHVERDAFVSVRARWRLRGRVCAPEFARAAAFPFINKYFSLRPSL
jgi:hypothetical protein